MDRPTPHRVRLTVRRRAACHPARAPDRLRPPGRRRPVRRARTALPLRRGAAQHGPAPVRPADWSRSRRLLPRVSDDVGDVITHTVVDNDIHIQHIEMHPLNTKGDSTRNSPSSAAKPSGQHTFRAPDSTQGPSPTSHDRRSRPSPPNPRPGRTSYARRKGDAPPFRDLAVIGISHPEANLGDKPLDRPLHLRPPGSRDRRLATGRARVDRHHQLRPCPAWSV